LPRAPKPTSSSRSDPAGSRPLASDSVPANQPSDSSAAPSQDAPPRLFAGTSGWAYPTWKPGFYPPKTPAKNFLPYYASRLTSVEVNYTFRTLPTTRMLEGWLAATPANFRFSFKAPQRITHFSRLRNAEARLAQFVAALEPARAAGRLGLLLFQLPPNFQADAGLLADFLAAPTLAAPGAPPIAFEFRHDSWFTDEIHTALADRNAALCIAESDTLASPEVHPATTHTSFRLRHNGGYTPAELATFAQRLLPLTEHRDVYVYFKHEDEPTGALNATAFLVEAATLASRV